MDEMHLESADAFMPRLIAIVESDRTENERIEKAMDMCAAYVADIKACHRIDAGKRPTPQERRTIESDVAAVRNAIANREAMLSDQSATRRVLKAARLAIQLDARASNAVGEILKKRVGRRSPSRGPR
jgi:hypothetical protein